MGSKCCHFDLSNLPALVSVTVVKTYNSIILTHCNFLLSVCLRSEGIWKEVGESGLAVEAPWPKADKEDKILTRQAKFLRDSLREFRTSAGRYKKSFSKASIVVSDTFPDWKVNVLVWMQEQFKPDTGFQSTFGKDLKEWAGKNVTDKKIMKNTMQFASFVKSEVNDVGVSAMDVQMPFDQKDLLEEVREYVMKQVNALELDVAKLDSDAASSVPPNIAENSTPGKPFLWLR